MKSISIKLLVLALGIRNLNITELFVWVDVYFTLNVTVKGGSFVKVN